tara:strand:+ start:1471 stop:1998 length:528 start_codon:yes stop_codon:yes gene_type:complete
MKISNFLFYAFVLILFSNLTACSGFKKVDQRQMPDGAKAKARKNIEEGRGTSLGGIIGKRGGSFEFSSSNPMWRATLETLDFLPMSTVDYSGGIIITDWYEDNQSPGKSIKITVRFLSNEISATSLKIVVHEKSCNPANNCSTKIITNSTIKNELNSVILKEAALIEKQSKSKKK